MSEWGTTRHTVLVQVRHTVAQHRMFAPGSHALLAISGGPDSLSMMAAMSKLQPELQLKLSACSVNHGLRDSAENDVNVAHKQAERFGIPFYPLRVEVNATTSLQAEAREARYATLFELRNQLEADTIVTGHTMDDQAETVLIKLSRNEGLNGLSAVQPKRADGVCRPLIDCRRSAVHAFAQAEKLPIAKDPSNENHRFLRVQIRELLLTWEKIDPRVVHHLAQLSHEFRASGLHKG